MKFFKYVLCFLFNPVNSVLLLKYRDTLFIEYNRDKCCPAKCSTQAYDKCNVQCHIKFAKFKYNLQLPSSNPILHKCDCSHFHVLEKDFTKNIELALNDYYILASVQLYLSLNNLQCYKFIKINLYLKEYFIKNSTVSKRLLKLNQDNLIAKFFDKFISNNSQEYLSRVPEIERMQKYFEIIQKSKKNKEINRNVEKFLCLVFNHLYKKILQLYALDYTESIAYLALHFDGLCYDTQNCITQRSIFALIALIKKYELLASPKPAFISAKIVAKYLEDIKKDSSLISIEAFLVLFKLKIDQVLIESTSLIFCEDLIRS